MNKLEQAFLNGFMKVAGLGSAVNSIKPAITGGLNSLKKAVPPAPPMIPPSVDQANVPKIPLISHPNDGKFNYSVEGMPQDIHEFHNQDPNTLNINAHGGAGFDNRYFYATDPSYVNPNEHINPGSTNKGLIDYYFEKAFRNYHPPIRFTPQQLAQQIGKGTNNIKNIYSLACNEGDGNCNTPINSTTNSSVNTPASERARYPNLTNVIMQPPGTLGAQIKGWYPTNMFQPTVDAFNAIAPFTGETNFSLPHQYNLQGGTNWVDKGSYYNY